MSASSKTPSKYRRLSGCRHECDCIIKYNKCIVNPKYNTIRYNGDNILIDFAKMNGTYDKMTDEEKDDLRNRQKSLNKQLDTITDPEILGQCTTCFSDDCEGCWDDEITA